MVIHRGENNRRVQTAYEEHWKNKKVSCQNRTMIGVKKQSEKQSADERFGKQTVRRWEIWLSKSAHEIFQQKTWIPRVIISEHSHPIW